MATGAMEITTNNKASATTASQTLNHIYFFLDQPAANATHTPTDETAASQPDSPQKSQSRASSPGSIGTDGSATVTGSVASTTSSNLNPHAATFSPGGSSAKAGPSSSPSAADQLYEVRKLEGKGFGLVATTVIPAGTRIICEKPLLRIPGEHFFLAWGSYSRLDKGQKETFDNLHSYVEDRDQMENLSRMYLIHSGSNMLESQIDEVVDEQVRVMSIFSVNNFNSPGGLAVYPTAARINHSCVPNTFHGFNPNLKRFTVHAVRDIAPGEEITISYMGSPATFLVRSQRVEHLRTHYGFTCTCPSCSDKTKVSDWRREQLGYICSGLGEYELGSPPAYPYIADGPAQAFDLAVNAVNFMNAEGLHTMEFIRALHAASKHALTLQDWHTALQYAMQEQEVQSNILGSEVQDLVKEGTAASCWVEHVKATITGALGREQARQLYAKYKVKPARPRPAEKGTPADKGLVTNQATPKKKKKSKTSAEKVAARKRRLEEEKSGAHEDFGDGGDGRAGTAQDPTKEEVKQVASHSWAKVAAGGGAESAEKGMGRENSAGKQRAE